MAYHESVRGVLNFCVGIFQQKGFARHRDLFNELVPRFTSTFVEDVLLPLIKQSANVSLRVLDWLCINYANVYHPLRVGGFASLKDAYDTKLKVYHRPLFDAFRRKEKFKVTFMYKDEEYTTTVAQLNFLLWCYEKEVYAYATEHCALIKSHMEQTNASNRLKKKGQRNQLTQRKAEKYTVSYQKVTVMDEEEDSDFYSDEEVL
jgi:hypothetical protein